jgi:hypothetical protein
MIAAKGRLGWQKAVGYGRRSLVETGMLRYKTIIGRTLRARTLPAQKVEARVGCKVLNRMTTSACPSLEDSPETPGKAATRPDLDLCTNASLGGSIVCDLTDTLPKPRWAN